MSAVFVMWTHMPGCLLQWLMALTLMSISLMGLSWPSMCLCCNSQSAIKILGLGLYIIWTLYWWILSNMHCCILLTSVATSFSNMDTNQVCGQWWQVSSLLKQYMMNNNENFSKQCDMSKAPLLMLLYLHSTPVKLLLAKGNRMKDYIVWCHVLLAYCVVMHNCSSEAPSPTPEASVSR